MIVEEVWKGILCLRHLLDINWNRRELSEEWDIKEEAESDLIGCWWNWSFASSPPPHPYLQHRGPQVVSPYVGTS
ncbi:hypothetical protein JTE90_000359 [Oedothorax gibbosus]|uniref:Uncharacterized protein n=1 Tax=Oedothorax gibbosus TaxID=931172 RepID=A0AAV6U2D7_9ARAC|nr:hypothetical protein JTE90_000359 [Oedothorax gibbosus]